MRHDLRILHVAETVRGGIATYLNELHALQAMELGAGNVAYVVPSHHRGDLSEIPDAAVVTFRSRGRTLPSLCAMAVAVLREVLARRPDVVHLHSTFAGAVLRPLLALLPGRPVVVYCPHGWAFSRDVSRASRLASRAVERLLAGLADRIVCISESERRAARACGLGEARLALVRNGLATARPDGRRRREAGPRAGPLRVLFVGRLDRQKGYDLLIAAAAQLSGAVSVRLVGASVVGAAAPAEPAAGNVTVVGWLPRARIEDEYDRADLVVMPSRWEGFGLVALEAMRAGRPVVAFRSGALAEIVLDGRTGILCATPDADGVAAALRRAAGMDLSGMGRRGAERFRTHFSVERTHRGLLAAYRSALARRRRCDPRPAIAPPRRA